MSHYIALAGLYSLWPGCFPMQRFTCLSLWIVRIKDMNHHAWLGKLFYVTFSIYDNILKDGFKRKGQDEWFNQCLLTCFKSHLRIYWSISRKHQNNTSYNMSCNQPKAEFWIKVKPGLRGAQLVTCLPNMTDLCLGLSIHTNKSGTTADRQTGHPATYWLAKSGWNSELQFSEVCFKNKVNIDSGSHHYPSAFPIPENTNVYTHMHTHYGRILVIEGTPN